MAQNLLGGRGVLTVLVLALGTLGSGAADDSLEAAMRGLDQSGTPTMPSAEAAPPEAMPPRYDGRAAPPTRLADVLLAIPRVALFPVHATLEYGVRRPAVAGLTWLETHHVPARVERVLTSDDGKRGVFPVFLFDVGLRPRVGLSSFAKELAGSSAQLGGGASIARAGVWRTYAQLRAPVLPADDGHLSLGVAYDTRDDAAFFGIGSDTRNEDRWFFRVNRLDAHVALDARIAGLSRLRTGLQMRRARFADSSYRTARPADEAPPPGFASGYEVGSAFAQLALDSRESSGDESLGSGVRFEGAGALAMELAQAGARYATWGGDLVGFLDLSGSGHLLVARVSGHVIERFTGSEVPFFELLGVDRHAAMRGFLGGRLRGESAFVAETQYRYPIWSFLDAELFVGAGNVFYGRFEGLAPERLFGSWGLSVRANDATSSHWGATLAFGTTRFDEATFSAADVVRVSIGYHQGF